MKTKAFTFLFLFLFATVLFPTLTHAQSLPQIDFFYSETCPHCIAEQGFLDGLQVRHPSASINRHVITDSENVAVLKERLEAVDAMQYFGVVPLTFVGEQYFVGFDSEDTTGVQIENALIGKEVTSNTAATCDEGEACGVESSGAPVAIPIIGTIDLEKYSLPTLAIVLGFLDGFNVCSLGALALILGIALALRSRKAIMVYGGVFVLTTAIVYGLLIYLWFALFSTLSRFVSLFEVVIGLIGIGGGLYFLKQFFYMKRVGVTCDSAGLPIVGKLTTWVQSKLEGKGGMLAITGAILGFAAIITIVEFPCSAAVPVMFAGVLATSNLSPVAYFSYMALFVLFYLLDELLIFGIAVYKMHLWLASSQKFVIWITFTEGLVLAGVGIFYLVKVLG